MTEAKPLPTAADVRSVAVGWALRIERQDMDDAGWVEFTGWIENPDHLAAFEGVQRRLGLIDRAVTAPAPTATVAKRSGPPVIWWAAGGGLALAASIAGVLVLAARGMGGGELEFDAVSEARTVALSDHTEVALRPGSVMTAAFDGRHRAVKLRPGSEAAFDVSKDHARPFEITIGQRLVRVLGTAFDVNYQPDVTRVAVSRGVVEVSSPGEPERTVILTAGQALKIRQAGADWSTHSVRPENVGAWRRHRLIFNNQPLSEVASEITDATDVAVEISPAAAALRFSGVLKLGSAAEMANALQLFLPVRAKAMPGRIVMERRRISP